MVMPTGRDLLGRAGAPRYTPDPALIAGAQAILNAFAMLQQGGVPMSQVLATIGADNPAAPMVQWQMQHMGMPMEQVARQLQELVSTYTPHPPPSPDITRARVPSPGELRGRPGPDTPVYGGPVPYERIGPGPDMPVYGGPVPYTRIPEQGLLDRVAQRPASRPVTPGPPAPRPALLSRLTAGARPRSLAGAPSGQTARLRRLMGGF